MAHAVGKIKFEAKKANEVRFSADGTHVWVKPLWGNPFAVGEGGVIEWPGQPLRSSIVWADAGRALFSSHVVEGPDAALEDVHRVVVLDAAGVAVAGPLEVARFRQDASSTGLVDVSADGRFVATLERAESGSVVLLWSLEHGRQLARHTLPQPADVVKAVSLAADAALVVAGDACVRFPVDGGERSTTRLDGARHVGALASIGGANRLPVSVAGDVLVQDQDGALSLFDPTGACLFRHGAPQSYLASEPRRIAAAISPSGAHVVAAVGIDATSGAACLEVFDRRGALVRRIDWKASKGESAYDVAIDDAGWIALATSHRAEIFAPEGFKSAKKR